MNWYKLPCYHLKASTFSTSLSSRIDAKFTRTNIPKKRIEPRSCVLYASFGRSCSCRPPFVIKKPRLRNVQNENRSARVAMLRISDELRGEYVGQLHTMQQGKCAAVFSNGGGGGGQGRRNPIGIWWDKEENQWHIRECSCTQGRAEALISSHCKRRRRDGIMEMKCRRSWSPRL